MAKKNSLREWFGQNKGKGWVDCKTGKPCGRQKGEKEKVILHVDQLWLNAHLQQKRKKALEELVGREKVVVVK